MNRAAPESGIEQVTKESPLFVHQFLDDVGWDAVVLDLGCGGGSIDYARYRCRFKACDSYRHPGVGLFPPHVEFTLAEADELPFESAFFHSVVCNWIFEHLHDPGAVLREIERVLKPGGYLYISVPNGRSFEDWLYRTLYKDQGGHVQRYSLGTFLRTVYAHSSFKLLSFADWSGGFVYLQHVRAGAHLRRALFSVFRLITKMTGRRVPERSNYVFLFQRGDGTGYRNVTDTCSFCGAGHEVPTPHPESSWVCPTCGKENPYV